ncbi:MAG: rRNA maturation RNase YbeY [Candidatus Kapaibacterium sp.]|nr:rRNA maturation RNase YbeY [Ignavibacteriota bacterium]MCB9221927.1 rRNA maturation RNase YbeY [Ignavibacteria bacterium]
MAIEINIIDKGKFGIIPVEKTNQIVKNLFSDYNVETALVNLIYVDDKEIHEINKKFLDHDYPTDVITFVLEEDENEADIIIGVETALENSKQYNATHESELLRLVAHGVLHLLGYDDHSDEEREAMHELENKYLGTVNE